jgi:outer membrane protein assembly factor BamB
MKTVAAVLWSLFLCGAQLEAADAPAPAPAKSPVCLKPVQELSVAAFQGADLFFADLDRDGRPEVIAYQGPGVFGASLYSGWPQVKPALPKTTCLNVFRGDGKRLWAWGTPNPADRPYTSHAYESCVATGDVDGDGRVEVALADGRRVYLFDGLTGRVRAQAEMREDNFYIVQVLGQPTGPGEAAVVVKNGEGGYGAWRYGEPLVALDAQLKPVWGPAAIPGAGHHILSLDLDGDNAKEFLIGYCAVKPSGKFAWTVDAINAAKLDPGRQHVDYTDLLRLPSGKMLLGIAGSDRSYLVECGGRTLFSTPGRHPQGSALGRFREDSEFQLAIYNADGPMVLYDPRGKELWQRSTPRRWPLGCPQVCEGRVFHRNGPIRPFSIPRLGKPAKDYIIFSDGGWPWGMDGDGNIGLEFQAPPHARQPEHELPPRARADDLGYGFATKIVDWDGDGRPEAVVFDRRWLWVYRAEPMIP